MNDQRKEDQGQRDGRTGRRCSKRRCQQQGRDQRHQIRLEHIGGHARAVPDVVPDIVGDSRGIARVIFGNRLLDLADQVRADIRRFGKNAAADPHEQRRQTAAEAEADQHLHGITLIEEKDECRAEQSEAHRHHPGDRAAFEGRFECAFVSRQRLVCRPLVARDRHSHADITGGVRQRNGRTKTPRRHRAREEDRRNRSKGKQVK